MLSCGSVRPLVKLSPLAVVWPPCSSAPAQDYLSLTSLPHGECPRLVLAFSRTRTSQLCHSPHTAARASALMHKKSGRKARINICSAGRLYLPLPTHFPGPPPTLLWLLRLVTLTRTRGWASQGGASLRQQHFSMNTHIHTRARTSSYSARHRGGKAPACEFSHSCKKKACCANRQSRLSSSRTDGRRPGQYLEPQSSKNWKHFKCGGEFITCCVKAVTLIYAWRSSVVI